MGIGYSDPRKLAFLAQIEEKYRSDVTNLFLRGVRQGLRTPPAIVATAYQWVGAREAELVHLGWTPGPGTVPAETLQGVIEGDPEGAEGFAAYLVEWESLSPTEKEALKGAHKRRYQGAVARGAR